MVCKETIINAKEDCAMNEINDEQSKRLLDLINTTDEEFYEKFLADVPLEELAAFLKEFPDFMEDGDEFDMNDEELLQKIQEKISNR